MPFYPSTTLFDGSLIVLFYYATKLFFWDSNIPTDRQKKFDLRTKNYLDENVYFCDEELFTEKQLASGFRDKSAAEIVSRMRKSANKHSVIGTTNGANWAKIRAIFTSLWIIQAFAGCRINNFTFELEELYTEYNKCRWMVTKLEKRGNKVMQKKFGGYSHQVFRKLVNLAEKVDKYNLEKEMEYSESYTIGRSQASEACFEDQFVDTEEMEYTQEEEFDWQYFLMECQFEKIDMEYRIRAAMNMSNFYD